MRWHLWLLLLAFGLVAWKAQEPAPVRQVSERLITADVVRPLIVELADDKYEGRGGGYPGERKAAEYIAKEFSAIGLQPMGDGVRGKRTFLQQFTFMPSSPVKPWETRKSNNVLALIEGSDPQLKGEIVVVGAHYDGQGRLGQADAGPRSKAKDTSDPIWNSANDDISGVSAIVSVARAMKQERPKRSVLFIAFGAEEHGMPGSIYYVNHPAFKLSQHVAMVNVECVGRMPEKPFNFNGSMTGAFWMATLKAANEQMGMSVQPNIPVPIPDSDHYPFASARIPAVMLIGGWDPDRHLPSDTADKIDFAQVAEAGRFVFAMVSDLANRAERPKFTQSMMPDLGMMANIATPAECDVIKLDQDQGCCRITGILPGRPAEKAGFQVGDAMLSVQGIKISRDFTVPQAQKMLEDILRGKHGNELKIIVQRKGKRLELMLPVTTK